jgi:hypothetical protein
MAIENMIRHYNNNKLTEFRKESFGRVFLTRQNRLLAKLVASRASHGQLHAQLIDYIMRILDTEAELHERIVDFKKNNIAKKHEV